MITRPDLLKILPLVCATLAFADTVPVSDLNLNQTVQDFGQPGINVSVNANPLSIGGRAFANGLGTHANSALWTDLNNNAVRFTALVGVDDEVKNSSASVEFKLKGDGQTLWQSGVMKAGDPAKAVDLDLHAIDKLTLIVTDADDGISSDHADWADAKIEYHGSRPQTMAAPARATVILTPAPSPAPRINGPTIFGVRPGSPFLYSIPATGDRPMTFAAAGLPSGLHLDPATGRITGKLSSPGSYPIVLGAENALGTANKKFRIVVGDDIALTPPMGWNSWNCWGEDVDQEKVLRSARALVAAGLDRHGWTYINIDDTWQGERGGPLNAIQPNKKFPVIKALAEEVHSLGLKVGIYSTPWTVSYGKRLGGSSNTSDGKWDAAANFNAGRNNHQMPFDVGPYKFAVQDARQWADWGFDYLKYDWGPVDAKNTREMADALKATGRDIVLSLSNNAAGNILPIMTDLAPLAQAWRTTNDINDSWRTMSGIGFNQDAWAPFQKPGHYNDPDMLVVGHVGWGRPHQTKLTADEQYTHLSLWAILGAPLLIGCDLEKLDAFTLGLLTNDEVLAVDQDALCKQGVRVGGKGALEVYAKPLEDGSVAVGLFNRSSDEAPVSALWTDLKLIGKHRVRDLWRQQDLGVFTGAFPATVAPHGVVFVQISPDR